MHRAFCVFIAGLVAGSKQGLAQNIPMPPMKYGYGDLAPFISESTMEHHVGIHKKHQEKLNLALASLRGDPGLKHLAKMGIDALLAHIEEIPDAATRQIVRRHGGGYVNHDLYFRSMAPQSAGSKMQAPPLPDAPSAKVKAVHLAMVDKEQPRPGEGSVLGMAIKKTFGSFEGLQAVVRSEAATLFGVGWVYLLLSDDHKLIVATYDGEDSPLMSQATTGRPAGTPILGIDLWEHAYLRDYSSTDDYLSAWWHIVNWPEVESRHSAVVRGLPHRTCTEPPCPAPASKKSSKKQEL